MDLLIILIQAVMGCVLIFILHRMFWKKKAADGGLRTPQSYDTAGRAGRYDPNGQPADRRRENDERGRCVSDGADAGFVTMHTHNGREEGSASSSYSSASSSSDSGSSSSDGDGGSD